MRGKTALIGFLVVELAVLIWWIGSIVPVLSSGAPFISPDAHIFTRSKLPWVGLPDDVPAFEVFYDLPNQWPPESLARLKAPTGG